VVFNAPAWKAPTPLHQGACTAAELAAFDACIGDPANCTSGSTPCDACIRTDVGAAAYGPFVTQTTGGTTTLVETNWGGCQANIDGDTKSGSCGDQTDTWQACAALECGSCTDVNDPTSGGPTDQCLAFAANSDEACADETELLTCANEWYSDSGVPECTEQTSLIAVWCGN
jgi:hypothetical protein